MEPPGFKNNTNIVYAINIPKIANFSELIKYRALRKYSFVNSFNVKNAYKHYKVLQGTTCIWKIQNTQQYFVLHAFKSDDELRSELS